MRIAVAADERTGIADAVVEELRRRGHEPIAPRRAERAERDDWAWASEAAARDVAEGRAEQAVVCCWTGTGASIAANKVAGIRAALCLDAPTAAGARRWNDANVLALSLRATSEAELAEILDAWFGPRTERRARRPRQRRAPRRDRAPRRAGSACASLLPDSGETTPAEQYSGLAWPRGARRPPLRRHELRRHGRRPRDDPGPLRADRHPHRHGGPSPAADPGRRGDDRRRRRCGPSATGASCPTRSFAGFASAPRGSPTTRSRSSSAAPSTCRGTAALFTGGWGRVADRRRQRRGASRDWRPRPGSMRFRGQRRPRRGCCACCAPSAACGRCSARAGPTSTASSSSSS